MFDSDYELIEIALGRLADRLPPGWVVERVEGQGTGTGRHQFDAFFSFEAESGGARGIALVEVRRYFSAADVERLFGGLTPRLRNAIGAQTILLVSEYLSPRTRDLLAKENISYLDLAGNVRLVMESPPIFVESSSANRRPSALASRRVAGLTGARAGRIIRFLAEVVPPYGVKEIEEAADISRGYVSRILDRLADEALIKRKPRGPVTHVDWMALLRVRGQSVDVFDINTARTFVAPNGARALFDGLQAQGMDKELVVTGSFAAVRKAPVAAPALLALYIVPASRQPSFKWLQNELRLLPAGEGGDVALLWPSDEAIVERPWTENGISFVNLPQLAIDCLGGTGRMPAEGEALLEWMEANRDMWQYPSLREFQDPCK